MTGPEFTTALKTLRWSRARFARVIGRHPNSMSNWTVDGPPPYAAAYLNLALGVQRLHQDMAKDFALVVSYPDSVYDPDRKVLTTVYPRTAGTAQSNFDKSRVEKKPA